ncbi:hypothetical protein L6R53_10230 [Myxococcota bacterium]|nr:hypothetical protein [Myxococcota bacterium]
MGPADLPDLARRGRRQLGRLLQREVVEDAAACARALTALVGRAPEGLSLPGGPSSVPRALLTGNALQVMAACPWPSAMMRQLDPDDPAFLPPLGMHPVLAARDRTLLGLPERGRLAWVDPLGWCGLGDGPAVTAWFGEGEPGGGGGCWPLGRAPDEARAPESAPVEQRRGEGGLGVVTRGRRGSLELELSILPVVLDGAVAWALVARLRRLGGSAGPAHLSFALRPAGTEGVRPVFQLARDAAGLWTADGVPILAVGERGQHALLGSHGQPDPWALLGAGGGGLQGAAAPGQVHCPVGLASGAEVYRAWLAPGQELARLAILAPPRRTAEVLERTSAESLWAGAQADRRGLLQSGCELVLSSHNHVLEAARQRLLVEPVDPDEAVSLGGLLGAVALARLGFQRRAADRIAAGLARVRRDGTLEGAEGPETAAALAWAAAEHLRWTDASTQARATRRAWLRLVEGLVRAPLQAGGFALFGSRGSRRWSAIWRAAALVGCAAVLRDHHHVARGEDATRWGLAGAAAAEELDGWLGDGPWTSARDRVHDGSAAALLAAVWLGVVSPQHRGVGPTLVALRQRQWHGGGVLLHGGAHIAATALLVAAEERRSPGLDQLDLVARLASPTGALPTARHPTRGAVGEGDDVLSAALFVLLAVERVQAGRGVLRLLPGLQRARGLPTPYGPIDVDSGRVRGQWRGAPPQVRIGGA